MDKLLSSQSFNFLSQYYAQDTHDGIFLAEYPSSNSPDTAFVNAEHYIIHDSFPPPTKKLLKYLGPHHLMLGWGNSLPVASEIKPSKLLLKHWSHHFGEEAIPKWKPVNQKDSYIELFPHETILPSQHTLEPDSLYFLHSKEALQHIKCLQPKPLPQWHIPSIAKLSHGYANTGNFMITSEAERSNTKAQVQQRWPESSLFFSEIIGEITNDICAQFYLNRQGDIQWLGVTQQLFNKENRWCGGTYDAEVQLTWKIKLANIVHKTAQYLSQEGYYGAVGIDVLENQKEELFLIDLNPRLNGSTPFVMACRLLSKNALNYGAYHPSIVVPFTAAQLIKECEEYENATIIVLAFYEEKNKTTCHLGIHASSKEQYVQAYDKVVEWTL